VLVVWGMNFFAHRLFVLNLGSIAIDVKKRVDGTVLSRRQSSTSLDSLNEEDPKQAKKLSAGS